MKPGVLNLTKTKKKKLQPYQAYLKLFKADLRPIIDQEYEALVRGLSPDDPVPDRFGFTIDFSRVLLAKETDEVKDLVEQYRLSQISDDEDEEVDGKERKR